MSLESVNTSSGASVNLENEDSKVLLNMAVRTVKKALEQSLENPEFLPLNTGAPVIDLTNILNRCKSDIIENKKCEVIRPAINNKDYRHATVGGVVEIGSSLTELQDVKRLFADFLDSQTGQIAPGVGAIEAHLSNQILQVGKEHAILINPDDINSTFKNIGMGVNKASAIKHSVIANKKEFSIDKEEKDGCSAGVISVLHEHGLAKNESEFNSIVAEFVDIAANKYLPKEFIESDGADGHDLVEDIKDELYHQAWKNGSDMQMFLGFLFEHSFSYGRRYIESFMMNKLVSSTDMQCKQQTTQYFDYVYNLIKNISSLEAFSFDVSRIIGGSSDNLEKISFDPINNMGINRLFYYLPVCLHQPNLFSEESKRLEWQTVADRTSTLKTKVGGRMTHDFNEIMYVYAGHVYKCTPRGSEETPYAIKLLTTLNEIGCLYERLQKKGVGISIEDFEVGLLRKYTEDVVCLGLANSFLWDGHTADRGYQYYHRLKQWLPTNDPLLLLERLSYMCLEMYHRHTKTSIMDKGIGEVFQAQAFCIENIFADTVVPDVLKVLKDVGTRPIRVGLTVRVSENILNTDAIKKWNNSIMGAKLRDLPVLIKREGESVYAHNIGWSSHLSFECVELTTDRGVDAESIGKDDDGYWLKLQREYELSTLTMNFSKDKSSVETIETKTSSKVKMLPVIIANQTNIGNSKGFLTIKVNEEYFNDSYYKVNNKPCAQKLIMRDMCFIVILHTVFQYIKEKFYSKTSRKVGVLRAHCNNNINSSAFHSCISAVSMNSQEMMVSTQGVDFTRSSHGPDIRALNLVPSMLKKSIEEHKSGAISEYCQDKVAVVVYITVRASYQKGWVKKHTLTCQGYFVDKGYFIPKFTESFNEPDGTDSWWLLMDRLMSLISEHTNCINVRVKDVVLIHRLKNAKRRGYTNSDNQVLFDDTTLKNINEKYESLSIIPLHMDEMFFIPDFLAKKTKKLNDVLVYKDLKQLDLVHRDGERVFVPILGYATMKTVGHGSGRFYNSMNLLYVDKKQLSERNLKNVDDAFMEAVSDIFLLSSINESENRSVVMNPYAWIRPKDIKYAGEVSYSDDRLSLVVSHTGICAALNTVSLGNNNG